MAIIVSQFIWSRSSTLYARKMSVLSRTQYAAILGEFIVSLCFGPSSATARDPISCLSMYPHELHRTPSKLS